MTNSDLIEFLEEPPSICMYGSAGTGKSTEVFSAFPNALFIVTSRGVLRAGASYIRDNPECGLVMPLPLIDEETGTPNTIELDEKNGVTRLKTKEGQREYTGLRRGAYIVLPEFMEDYDTRVNNWAQLTAYVNAFINRVKVEPKRYDALVLDEMSTFSARVYEDIKLDKRFRAQSGKTDVFKATNELHIFHRWLGKFVPRAAKKALVLVCHATEPKYHEEEGDPRKGLLKYQGGPKFPIGSLIESVTADMDIVLHLVARADMDGTERVYLTSADPLWARKFRDFAIKAKEKIGLRALLARAGYSV